MFEADPTHYQTSSLLSTCCDGIASVYLGRHLPSGSMVAIKKFNLDNSKEEENLIQREIIVTRQLQHPNVLAYHTAFVTGLEVCVVSPLMGFGSCQSLLAEHFVDGLPELAIAHIVRDVLQGLEYIHRKGYIHRAVRASHILVSACGRACLSGLRYACHIVENGRWQRSIHSFPHSSARNLNWLSPEMLEQNIHGYNEKSDVYSVGVTLCELANGVVPFADMPTTLMLIEKVRGCAPLLFDCTTLPLYEDLEPGQNVQNASTSNVQYKAMQQRRFSEASHQLAELCLQREPTLRPSAGQLLAHSFFKQCKRSGATMAELLHPALPFSDARGDAQDKLAEMELEPDQWDF
ncbi:STE20-related kinase adapter protein alpha isoform X2 [Bacillus rossius redtenbacheri]|uniref:STE20-related kinase adapter protein alpha isoform X2 n=1 Tax=Bacillus rossius redtenbacheri TaxID=93214 RepID=UPI002FDE45F3